MTDVKLTGGGAIPLVGFGTWQLRGAKAYQAVGQALKVGYRHLDTATMYGNEAECGRAWRDSGVPREQVFITTKLPGGRFDRARGTLTESLRALGTEYVDLWLIHWPPSRGAGIPVWRELLAARDEGQARAVGVSNYSTALIDELIKATGEAPAVNQIPWSPSQYDAGEVAALRDRGVVLEGYSPIKGTNLRHPVLVELAQRHGVSVPQVVLRWHVEHGIVVIPKSARPDRIAANFDIFGFALTPDEVAAVDGLAR